METELPRGFFEYHHRGISPFDFKIGDVVLDILDPEKRKITVIGKDTLESHGLKYNNYKCAWFEGDYYHEADFFGYWLVRAD